MILSWPAPGACAGLATNVSKSRDTVRFALGKRAVRLASPAAWADFWSYRCLEPRFKEIWL
jgi:hypothetical protein